MSQASIVVVDSFHPQPRRVDRAVRMLESGGLIAYPTDTYYGIGCDLLSKKAIERLCNLKGRDRRKTFAFLCPNLSDVAKYAIVSNFAYRYMKQLTPGPFTFVLEATRLVPSILHSKRQQIGIRVPQAPLVLEIAKQLGRPIITTSASTQDNQALIDARSIKEKLGNRLNLILDGGVQLSEPSTVVSLIGDRMEVLRQGKGILVIG